MDSLRDLCAQLFGQWSEQGAEIAAIEGYECGLLDAAEGKPERETLPYDISRIFKDDYERGYREGYEHGSEQPEF